MHLPGPLRAAVGLVASAADEARHLPDRAIELPMLAVSTALQASLRAQQRYARLAARGDQVLNRRPATDEPPAWATFDDPVSVDELRRTAESGPNGFGGPDSDASRLLDELFGVGDPAANLRAPAPAEVADLSEARQAAAKKAPVAKKAAIAKKAATKKPAAKAVKKATAKKAAPAAKSAPRGKTVNQPRHTAPSAFDAAGDD